VNGEDLDVASDSNHGKNIVGRLGTKGRKSNIGVSYYDGTLAERNSSSAYTGSGVIQDVNRFGVDAFYTGGPVAIVSEYLKGKNGSTDADGWYVTLGYQSAGSPHQTYVRYDTYNPNIDTGNNDYRRWTFGHSIYFSKLTKFTVEYESVDNEAAPDYNGTLTTQFQVVF
jgi:hypothetical protein